VTEARREVVCEGDDLEEAARVRRRGEGGSVNPNLCAHCEAARAAREGGRRSPATRRPASGTVVGTADGDRASAASGLPVVWWARAETETGEGGWWRGLVLTHLGLGEWNRWDDDDDDVFVFPQSNWAETGRSVWASLFRKWYGPGPRAARGQEMGRTGQAPRAKSREGCCRKCDAPCARTIQIPPPPREDAIADVAELRVCYYR
jgi:hypothetical protein